MIHSYYQSATLWIHLHPHWGFLAAFLVAFSESIAVVGTIIPGSVTMTAIGALAGSGVLPLWVVLLFSIFGAILGDGISYLVGFYFKEQVTLFWPFSKYPSILSKGKEFVSDHGGKSVFIGRFVGPVRAIVPVIAGILNLPPRRYFPISIASAILWAPFYMLPGIFLGAISLEMPPHIAAELIIFVISISLLCWLIFRLIKYIYTKSNRFFAQLIDKHWSRWERHSSTRWICFLLKNGSHPNQHGQLFLGTLLLIGVSLFSFTFYEVLTHGALLQINSIGYHVFRGLRTKTLDFIAIALTSLGQVQVIVPLVVCVLLWFVYKKQRLAALHWIFASGSSLLAVFIIKHVYFSPRPSGILIPPPYSSFPSGHTAFVIAIYGFLAFLIANHKSKDTKRTIYWPVVIICLATAITRMYLCVHWLTDILGSVLIGLSILFATIISYRRFSAKAFSIFPVLLIAFLALGISDGTYLYFNYRTDLKNFSPFWKTYFIPEQAWWENQSPLIPSYRMNRFGVPEEVLNVEWAASSLDEIRETLDKAGWKNLHVTTRMASTLPTKEKKEIAKNKTILPKLFNDHKPVLELVNLNDRNPPLILQMWPAYIILIPNQQSLWVGTLHYDLKKHYRFSSSGMNHNPSGLLSDPTVLLAAGLERHHWITRLTPKSDLPKRLLKHQPAYQLILIKPQYPLITQKQETSHVSS